MSLESASLDQFIAKEILYFSYDFTQVYQREPTNKNALI